MHIGHLGRTGRMHLASGAGPYASPATKTPKRSDRIGAPGSGISSQSQFKQALNAINPPGASKKAEAGAIFSEPDPENSGTVYKSDFVSSMTGLMRSLGDRPSVSTSDVSGSTTTAPSPDQTRASGQQPPNPLGGSPDALDGIGTILDLTA